MDRAGEFHTPLGADELASVFESVSSGDDAARAHQTLPGRNRTTIRRAFNVASEFERRNLNTLDPEVVSEIARAAGYSTTSRYVETLFLKWSAWRTRASSTADDLPLARLAVAKEAHFNELMAFGSRLRDRLAVRLASEHEAEARKVEAVWHGRDFHLIRDGGEGDEEQLWGSGLCRRKRHYLFRAVRSHLRHNSCWGILDKFENELAKYYSAERQLVERLRNMIDSEHELASFRVRELEAARFLQRRALWAVADQVRWKHEQVFLAGLFDKASFDDGTAGETPGFYQYLEPPIFEGDLRNLQLIEPGTAYRALARAAEANSGVANALVQWRVTAGTLSILAFEWARSIGPDSALRQAITMGSCNLCPA